MRLSVVREDLAAQDFNNAWRLVVRGKKVTATKRKVAGSIPACENSSSVVDAPRPEVVGSNPTCVSSSSVVEHGDSWGISSIGRAPALQEQEVVGSNPAFSTTIPISVKDEIEFKLPSRD